MFKTRVFQAQPISKKRLPTTLKSESSNDSPCVIALLSPKAKTAPEVVRLSYFIDLLTIPVPSFICKPQSRELLKSLSPKPIVILALLIFVESIPFRSIKANSLSTIAILFSILRACFSAASSFKVSASDFVITSDCKREFMVSILNFKASFSS